MDPIISSILTLIIGKLIDSYFTRSKKYPKYIGSVAYLKNKLKKREVIKMTGYKTKVGCIIVFLGGVVAVLKGVIAEPVDPNAIWLGASAAAGAFAGWGIGDKVQRLLNSRNIR